MNTIKFFISSDTDELKDERLIAKKVIKNLGFESIMCENFGARTETIRTVYHQELKNSQVYLGMFYKKASKPTFEEYSKALKWKKDILIYLKKADKRDERLAKFIKKVKRSHSISKFENIAELERKIKNDLLSLVSRAYLKTLPSISKKRLRKETGIENIIAIESALDVLCLLRLVGKRISRGEEKYRLTEEFRKSFVRNLAEAISGMKVKKITLRSMRTSVDEAVILTFMDKVEEATTRQVHRYANILHAMLPSAGRKQFLEKLLNITKPFFKGSNEKKKRKTTRKPSRRIR